MKLLKFKSLATASVVAMAMPMAAHASAIITDGNVSLGVEDFGQLNVSGGVADVTGQTKVGTRWIDGSGVEYESTSHGCECEGWGLAVDGTAGYANDSIGTAGLTGISFGSTATTASSTVGITGTDVTVTHDFALSTKTDDLFEVTVSITNTGATDIAAMEYRRVMDWDTSPTPFSEFVTIGGTATTTLLDGASDNGFLSGNPLTAITDLAGCGIDVDFTACGPSDHGAVFDFALGALAAGETYSFTIFYGGAANKTEADAALSAVGAELYSYGWSSTDTDQDGYNDRTGAITPTFIFAFAGVGGKPVIPPTGAIPLPAGGVLLLSGLGMIAGLRKRKKA